MTYVLSLTVATSASFGSAQSLYMVLEQERASLEELSYIGAMGDHALKTYTSVVTITFTTHVVDWDNTVYDTNSFTDAGCGTVLRIQNDKWSWVEIGACGNVNKANDGNWFIRKNGDTTYLGMPTISCDYVSAADEAYVGNLTTGPIPVSSGDYFEVINDSGLVRYLRVDSASAFWIRGLSRG